jgi:uncharacterized protein (DUF362 family)
MGKDGLSRREFIALGAKTAGAFLVSNSIFPTISFAGESGKIPVAVRVNPDIETALSGALEALGGMRKFISKNDIVLIKPNIGWDRVPDQAANTDPQLVISLVRRVLDAGAKEVRIFDRTCNEPRRCYINSGIEPLVEEFSEKEGVKDSVKIYHVKKRDFVKVKIQNAQVLKKWPLYRDAMEVDKIVNVPVAKHHSLADYTLSLKNMMGIMGGNRSRIHWGLPGALADLNGFLKTHLAVIDGTKILLRNGPSGGNLEDVARKDTIIVSPNPVAADAVATAVLFGADPGRVSHIREASNRGLGPYEKEKILVTHS